MSRTTWMCAALLFTQSCFAAGAAAPVFRGTAALEFARKATSFGPRPSGSGAIRKLQAYLHTQLKLLRCQVTDDNFRGSTPLGAVPMQNIIVRFPGTSGRIVAITGHYDTKSMPGTDFVGANDGGSSAGFLLELARAVAGMKHKNDIWLVWFDGEEAVVEFNSTDGTYGSRHLASRWAGDGTLAKLKALINVDMIGDRDLGILSDGNSTEALRRLVWDTAEQLGLGKFFLKTPNAILDDHLPFVEAGAQAVDLIDFDYGPGNSYWHTDRDTVDKLSAHSFEVVGKLVLEAIRKLE